MITVISLPLLFEWVHYREYRKAEGRNSGLDSRRENKIKL